MSKVFMEEGRANNTRIIQFIGGSFAERVFALSAYLQGHLELDGRVYSSEITGHHGGRFGGDVKTLDALSVECRD